MSHRRSVLLCDADRAHSEALAGRLLELGYAVEVVRAYAEAFAIACAHDLDAMIVAPTLIDGSALVLPAALGIRRPPMVILATSLSERLGRAVTRRVGFDVQLTKVIDPAVVDRILKYGITELTPESRALPHRPCGNASSGQSRPTD